MLTGLFRQQAIDALQVHSTGRVASIAPISAWFLTAFLSIIAAASIAFLFFGSYTKKERVSGVLMPAAGVIRLRAPESAVVTTIAVREGQSVKAGDVLMEITQERFSDQGATQTLIEQNLKLQREQLLVQSRQTAIAGVAGVASVQERARRATADLANIAEEIRLHQQQVASSERVLANLKPLADEKIVSDIQFQQQSNQVLELRARLEALRRTQEALRAEVSMARSEGASISAKTNADKATLERGLLALDQDRTQRRTASVTQIRAPVSGILTALLASVGQRVDAAMSLAALIPADSKMEAVLFVPSSAIGFIKPGRKVILRYDAFPFEKFGQYEGAVLSVSEADVPTLDLASPAAAPVLNDKRTTFRIRVALDKDHIEAYGARVRLKPGQTLAADIELDRRRLIQWMFDPLYALGKRL